MHASMGQHSYHKMPGPGTITHYYMRAIDSSTGRWVYWFATDPTATPLATSTNPSYAGTLSSSTIVFSSVGPIIADPTGLVLNFVRWDNSPSAGSIFPKTFKAFFSGSINLSQVTAGNPPIFKAAFNPLVIGPGPGVSAGGETWLYTGSQVVRL